MPPVRLTDLFGSDEPDGSPESTSEAPAHTGQLVWQYRGRSTTESILRNHALRAFDVRSFKDRHELCIGNRIVRQAFRDLVDLWDCRDEPGHDWGSIAEVLKDADSDIFQASTFVSCFSHHGDLERQWQDYTGDDGFSIGIPEGVRLPVLGVSDGSRHAFYDEQPLRWLAMLYGKKQQLDAAHQAIHEVMQDFELGYPGQSDPEFDGSGMFRDRLSSAYTNIVARLKAERYRSEDEVRYTIARSHGSGGIEIDNHPDRGRREYLTVTGAAGDPFDLEWDRHEPEVYQVEASVLPIRAIYISPKVDFDMECAWLLNVLEEMDYRDVEIRRSDLARP